MKPIPFSLRILLLLSLSGLVFAGALAVIYSKHTHRQLFMQLQNLQQEIESLQVEWGQLLLEQRTWSSEARVEQVARQQLGMIFPEPNQIVVIP